MRTRLSHNLPGPKPLQPIGCQLYKLEKGKEGLRKRAFHHLDVKSKRGLGKHAAWHVSLHETLPRTGSLLVWVSSEWQHPLLPRDASVEEVLLLLQSWKANCSLQRPYFLDLC